MGDSAEDRPMAEPRVLLKVSTVNPVTVAGPAFAMSLVALFVHCHHHGLTQKVAALVAHSGPPCVQRQSPSAAEMFAGSAGPPSGVVHDLFGEAEVAHRMGVEIGEAPDGRIPVVKLPVERDDGRILLTADRHAR